MTREEVVEKVKKLFALGESDNPHEAALAVGRAQALMERHAIEAAEVDGGKDDEILEFPFGPQLRRRSTWQGYLAYMIAEANGCFAVHQGGSIVIAGRKEDVAAATRMRDYCHTEIDRLAAKFAAGKGRGWGASFRLGCVHAVQIEVTEERSALRDAMRGKVSEAALVVIDDRSSRAKESLGPIRKRRGSLDVQEEAAAVGRSAGRAIYSGTKGRIEG